MPDSIDFGAIEAACFSSVWPTIGHDRVFDTNLRSALSLAGAVGVVTYIAERRVSFSRFVLRLGLTKEQLEDIEHCVHTVVRAEHKKISAEEEQNAGTARLRMSQPIAIDLEPAKSANGGGGIGRILAAATGKSANKVGAFAAIICDEQPVADGKSKKISSADQLRPIIWPHDPDDLNYAVLFYDRSKVRNEVRYAEYLASRGLRTILFVMRRRERMFAPFPPKISKRYWNDAEPRRLTAPNALAPPFESPSKPRRTVTLSFDLRKSTFCMAQADELSEYARWIDQFVQTMIAVTHANGGVFGAFTGDGCIAHFLIDEYKAVFRNRTRPKEEEKTPNAVVAALECATDMQRAVGHLLEQLYPNLRMRSDLLGAGIAIAFGSAHWSYDYSDYYSNLIVVGPSIVDACRLCDSADADTILMGENAYMALPEPLRTALRSKRVKVQTKEYRDTQQITAWKVKRPWLERHYGTPEHRNVVEAICEQVRKRSEERLPPNEDER